MKKHEKETQSGRFQTLWHRTKKWICGIGIVTALAGGIVTTDLVDPSEATTVYALTLPEGAVKLGEINGAPVIKSPTDNMASETFQEIIAGLLEETGNPPYIINQAAWGSSTSLFNGQPLSSISLAAVNIFGADGFLPTDQAIEMTVGQTSYIQNVGTAIKTETGELIPISLAVTVNSATQPDGSPLSTVVMGAKSQSSVITLAWGSIVRGGSNTGGGQTEGGGIGGGDVEDGTLMGYIESVSYTLTFINSDTGQPLPNTTLMPIKNSDIDANQLAEMDGNGAFGYILSPDTALTQVGNGFRSTSNGAVNEDSSDLTENSYVVIKQYNSNLVQYRYMDGAHDHLDIVTGHFGNTPFKLSELLGGYLEIDKSTLAYGKDEWNSNYSFKGLLFDIVDKDGKVVGTIALDQNGKGKSERIPKGNYTLKERATDWSITGQTVRANETTIVKTGETTTVALKNKVVVGQNTLQKIDADTGKEQNGKANLKTGKYQLFYNDTSTGSAAHKAGDPVKWTDTPAPKLLAGEKVTSALIGGQTVDFGDKVVIDVDDDTLQASIGNLALGKYKWIEVDAPEGYVVDPTEHTFEIKYKDQNTETVIAAEQTSKEQIIDAAIKINKMFTLPDNQGGSGFNGIEFTVTPLEGTVAEPIVMVTGVNPVTGDDGYATGNLIYGDWVLEETSDPEDREKIRPIYIQMETDLETDILTISASYNKDFSKPFSTRKFALLDSSTEANPNNQGTVGNVTSEKPTISLSTLHFNNNPKEPETPAIDVEKANIAVPDAGLGNGQDLPNNVENDYDDPEAPFIVDAEEETDIFFRVTNTGTEDLTNIKPVDKTTEGTISIKDITWEFELNEDGYVLDKEGELLVLKPGESFTGQGTLPQLPEGELHADKITVVAVGVTSKTEVEDDDLWHGIVTEEPKEPGIDVEKSNVDYPEAGAGNGQDAPNNVDNDYDDPENPFAVDAKKETEIFFKVTNTGNEELTNIKPVDQTTEGTISIKDITWEFDLNEDGYVLDKEGKLLVLKPGESFTGKGTLPELPEGELHADKITVEAVGVMSKKEVKDDDLWHGIVNPEEPAATEEPSKSSGIQQFYPNTGEKQVAYLVAIGIVMVCIVVVSKRDQLAFAIRSVKRRLKK